MTHAGRQDQGLLEIEAMPEAVELAVSTSSDAPSNVGSSLRAGRQEAVGTGARSCGAAVARAGRAGELAGGRA